MLEASAAETRPGRHTTAWLTPDLPRVWDVNLVRIERLPRVAAARTLAAEADALLGAADLEHRRLLADVEDHGLAVSAGLAALGWSSEVHAVLAWDGGRPPEARQTALVGPEEAQPVYAEMNAAAGYDEVTARQLLAHATHTPASGPRLRRMAARDADGAIGSLANLFDDGRTAEIDNLATLPGRQRRGLARAVTCGAVRRAQDEGCDLIFLRADERDWPVEWYGRLGFRLVGRQYVFSRT